MTTMRLCCRLYAVPGWIRWVGGIAALVLGVPLFILPIPLGLAMIAAGLALIYTALPGQHKPLSVLKKRAPALYRLVRPVLERCAQCPPAR